MTQNIDNARTFNSSVLQVVGANAGAINYAAQVAGVSPLSVASPIAREMNKTVEEYDKSLIRTLFLPVKEFIINWQLDSNDLDGYIPQTNESLLADLSIVRSYDISNVGLAGNFQRLMHPTLNDIGPGKIQIGTVIEAVDYYAQNLDKFGGSDALDLLKYVGHADALVRDLDSANDAMAPTISISAIISRQATDWFETAILYLPHPAGGR